MWQIEYALAVPINLEFGFDFRPLSECDFLTGASVVRHFLYFYEDGTKVEIPS